MSTRQQMRKDAEILKVTCMAVDQPAEISRFVLYLDSVPEWHSLLEYVKSGSTEGWSGRFSALAQGVSVAYVRLDDPWAVHTIRTKWA